MYKSKNDMKHTRNEIVRFEFKHGMNILHRNFVSIPELRLLLTHKLQYKIIMDFWQIALQTYIKQNVETNIYISLTSW